MLKICRELVLGFVVLVGSTCVTPTHVSSAFSGGAPPIIFTYVQAAGPTGARDEAIVLFNQSAEAIDITNWCITNKQSNDFFCFSPNGSYVTQEIPAGGHIVLVSRAYSERIGEAATADKFIFEPVHATNGSITGSADTLSLKDRHKTIITQYAWAAVVPTGRAFQRISTGQQGSTTYAASGLAEDWSIVAYPVQLPQNAVIEIETEETPEAPVDEGSLPALYHPIITEVSPNPKGPDANNEFIELFNPHRHAVLLDGYTLAVTGKQYAFPPGILLEPGEYKAFTNVDIAFRLINTTATVQLFYGTQPLNDSIEYHAPKEGDSWALLDDAWAYTTISSPAAKNSASPMEVSPVAKARPVAVPTLKPCAAHQYRSPETNRCRSVEAQAAKVACKAGQTRNPETGRCRAVAAVNTRVPCKEGQERNAETNRCRTIEKMSKAPHALSKVTQQQGAGPSWYVWLAIIGLILAVVGYGVWEWRYELIKVWGQLRKRSRTGQE